MSQKEYLILLSTFVPFGPVRIKLLLKYFGSARRVWTAEDKHLSKLGLGEGKVIEFIAHRENFGAAKYLNNLEKLKIDCVTISDKSYPKNLREIEDAPFVLYIKGTLRPTDVNSVAIVGSRKMTAYGREVADRFSSELAACGVTIISGLARGIDSEAHRAALMAGGRTIAVIGAGLDNIYPPENTKLAEEITKNGAVISEYPLGYPALPINFAARNRIVSGLSRAVVVVEGATKSGTLLTATAAAKQGKEVFAVPGQITSPMSGAPLFLLKNGARLATTPSDILEELNLQLRVDKEAVEKVMPSDALEAKIVKYLENEALHLDELARISTLGVGVLSAKLTVMELKGLVKSLGAGIYKKI